MAGGDGRWRGVSVGGVATICFVKTNKVKVDTLVHCFLSGKGGINNCSGAPSNLARRLGCRKTTVRCRSGISLVPSSFASPTGALIICAPTIPRSRSRLYCFQKGNFRIVGHTHILNRVANYGQKLYITNARNGAAASSVITRLLGRSRISYGTFLNNVLGGCSDGLVLSSGDSLAIVRTSRFSHSFR